MKKKCMKCGGDGYIPEYSWNVGGKCFLCNGTGEIESFDRNEYEKQIGVDNIYDYADHVSTADIVETIKSGKINDLPAKHARELNEVLKERAVKLEVDPRSEDLAGDVSIAMSSMKSSMPTPWKNSGYAKTGKVTEVPTHWLKKFQGNPLRRDSQEMKEFAEKLKREGLKDPVIIIIGQEDRMVHVGEGNHRLFGFIEAGLDKIPARVMRQTNGGQGIHYDKMIKVPKDGYFPGDASPEDVFDTFYDANDETEPEEGKTNSDENGEENLMDDVETTFGDGGDIDLDDILAEYEEEDDRLSNLLYGDPSDRDKKDYTNTDSYKMIGYDVSGTDINDVIFYEPEKELSDDEEYLATALFKILSDSFGFDNFREMIPKLKEYDILNEIRGNHVLNFKRVKEFIEIMSM